MSKQTAYVLHSRPYKETSALVDFFTPDYGLIRCMAKGVKKHLSQGQSLQPFVKYYIQFHGQSDLKTLDQFESVELPLPLQGDRLYSGFYVNEVLIRALRSDAEVEADALFEAYEHALKAITSRHLEASLRLFELSLLEHMGQSYEWCFDFKSGEMVDAETDYGFFVEQGMARVSPIYAGKNPKACFKGMDLLALSEQNFEHKSTLDAAKRLLRLALRPIIGYKPIQARELIKFYRQLGETESSTSNLSE